MEYLQESNGGREGKELPADIILLNLNMPRMCGRSAFKQIKTSPDYRSIPVVILTTSGDHEDVIECYNFSAGSFITKPEGFENLQEVVQPLVNYWMCTAQVPRR